MPLAALEHPHESIETYIWGLLPDNELVLPRWAKNFQALARNAFALISQVGEDCAGAVQFVRPERVEAVLQTGGDDIAWLDEAGIAERLRALKSDRSAWRLAGDVGQFSLAGAQPKTALLLQDGRWGAPSGRIPTTHDHKKAAARLQAALSVGDAIGSWEWDVVKDRVTADQQFAVIYNVDPARAAAGTPVSEFLHCIHPDDLPLVQSQIDTAVRYGDHCQAEYRIVDRMGEIHWISAEGRAVLDDTGSCVRFPGVCFDITINEKIEAEREGSASSQR